MSKICWLGVDLGETEFVAAVAFEDAASDWAQLPYRSFKNTKAGIHAFVKWARRCTANGTLGGLCVEALGAPMWDWMEILNERLGPVSPVNPKRTAQFGKVLGIADKTDRVDACILALFGLRMTPVARALPDPQIRQMRELCHFRDALRQDRQALQNRLRTVKLPALIREEAEVEVVRMKSFLKRIDQEIDGMITANPSMAHDCALLETIPGVARLTAVRVMSELGDLRQYTREEITALAGLYPRQYESGTSVRKRPRLAKTGKARVRSALYYPAMSARQHCAPLRAFADRLCARGMAKKAALLAVERKLLLLMRALLVSNTPYQDPAPTATKPTTPEPIIALALTSALRVSCPTSAAQDRATLASDPSGACGSKTMRRGRTQKLPRTPHRIGHKAINAKTRRYLQSAT
jgi:transposase